MRKAAEEVKALVEQQAEALKECGEERQRVKELIDRAASLS